jgi:hypothetical protein
MAVLGEGNCKWHFAEKSENGWENGCNDPMSENFRRTPYASLIREAIQNSLDARLDESMPVEVDFSINSFDAEKFPNFFNITEHLSACKNYFEDAPEVYNPMIKYVNSHRKKMDYIKVSDRNTTGMMFTKGSQKSPFYAFVRSGGVSSKTGKDAGGSYGFGKAAYFYLSPFRTILVSTCAVDRNNPESCHYFFEGASMLCTHKIGDVKREGTGFYDNQNGLPVSNLDEIPFRFRRKGSRCEDIGPGTDIFIMGVEYDDEKKRTADPIYKEMIEATLRNFWLSIYKKQLVVKIGDTLIDESTLPKLLTKTFDENDCTGPRAKVNPRPFYDTVANIGADDKHALYSLDLNQVTDLTRLKRDTNWGCIHFYLWKRKNASKRIMFMRKPLMLVYSSTKYTMGDSYYGVLIVPEGYANELLRSIENPAHDKWEKSQLRSKSDRVLPGALQDVIDNFINESLANFFNRERQEVLQVKGLEQYLYYPSSYTGDVDDEYYPSVRNGHKTDILNDEMGAPTTTANDISTANSPSNETLIIVKNPANGKPSSDGNMYSGNGDTHIKNPGGGGVSASNPTNPNVEVAGGKSNGSYFKPMKVRYRTFAQTHGNRVVHHIVINSPVDTKNGKIDFMVGGDSSKSKINLESLAGEGKIDKNSIFVELKAGKNEFDICFCDNLKHSIIINASYEDK